MNKKLLTIAILSALGTTACNNGSSDAPAVAAATALQFKSIEFVGMPAPSADADIARTYSAASAVVTYSDNTTKTFPLTYNLLFKVTDKIGANANAAGQLYARDGSPLQDALGQPVIAETPDGNSLLKVDGAPATGLGGNPLYLVTHYEYDWLLSDGSDAGAWYERMPMAMTLTTIDQNPATGALTAAAQRSIDMSGVEGLWIPCFASQTPWNTHLGSEENYDADAKTIESGAGTVLDGLNDLYYATPASATAKPYNYGIFPEVTVNADGTTTVAKHYSMGRGTWEMGKVMPDARTVYYGDDGTNTGLFMYVADRANDLSAGTLYAAKWIQVSADNAGQATLTWVKLGHATDAEIKALTGLKFSDIFLASTDPASVADGYKAIRAGSSTTEYLKLKPGMEQAAAFLETRRYAAWLGATTEFNKMEGVAVNAADKQLYVAMSYIDKGMLAVSSAPADHIRISKLNAGATYALSLAGSQRDTGGDLIDSDYVAVDMKGYVLGEDIATDALGNKANPDKPANPDNIFYSEKMRTLFIGEDSGLHVNNFVWAYNVDSGKLSRVLSIVAGGEATGLQVLDDMNGYAYIMSNAQHQGDFISSTNAELKARIEGGINKFEAPIGYIGGIPGL